MLNPGAATDLPDRMDGVDALFIDREGTGLSLDEAARRVATAAALGIASVIRTDGLDPAELERCVGLNPNAVVLPQLISARQALSALPVFEATATQIIAQIETTEAVETLADFIEVDGVSAFLIGPNDLAAAMGFDGQPDHPEVTTVVEDVARRLRDARRPFGLPTLTRSAREAWIAKGAQLHYLPLAAFLDMETG